MRRRIAVFVVIVQSILLLVHWFIYSTWVGFEAVPDPPGITPLQTVVGILSVSFVVASILARRYFNAWARSLYRIAATWLGLVNFLFLAACLCWIVALGARAAHVALDASLLVKILFGAALLAGIYGLINARWVRIKRITVKLPNLPPSWRGRVAALVSDVHLGHINGARFMGRIIIRLKRLAPDVVFLTGDLYDGTKIDASTVAASWKDISPPLGSYFVTGNHEEFSSPLEYIHAVRDTGVRVLNNEKVDLDGLQLVGVDHHDSTNSERFQAILEHADLREGEPSILLSHAPHALEVPERAGVSLQLSGHTHGGQIFPFTWFTRRIFRQYTSGLQQFGKMLVYTTTGAGTWGPPMRVGTRPEIVLIEFA